MKLYNRYSWLMIGLLLLSTCSTQGNVLFLAHFDKYQCDADYSAGGLVSAIQTSGTRGGELGFFPGSPSGAADVGYRTQPTSNLILPAKGSLDTRQGTIDFFLRTAWDWNAKEIAGRGHPIHLYIPLENNGHIMIYTYHHEQSGWVSLAFNMYDGQQDHPILAGVSPVGKREVENPWKKDEWHHIAVSWTPTQMRLFADGKLVATKQWDPPLNLGAVKGDMWVGGGPSGASRELLDELRIQDVAVDQITVPTKPYTTPEPAKARVGTKEKDGPWTTVPCYKTKTPPTLDGRLTDPVWKEVPWIGSFRRISSKTVYATIPTRFAFCYDDQALYLAVVCSEPNMSGLKAKLVGQDVPVFGEDAIEFFVDPGRHFLSYYQIIFNTIGGRYDGKGFDVKWNGDWKVDVAKSEKQWSALLKLPFETVGAKPVAGELWGFNFARDRYASGGLDLSTFSPVTGFHEPRSFAALCFEPALSSSPGTEEVKLNRDYLEESLTLVENNRTLWQRQLNRSLRQMKARQTSGVLAADAKRLAEIVKQLGQTGKTLAVLDEARVAMTTLGSQVDQLVARVQQTVPVGPLKPPVDLKPGLNRRGTLWYFVADQALFAIDGRTGILAGVWERAKGTRCIAAGADHYWLETVKASNEADELDDKAQATEKKDRLILSCVNPDLPGMTLIKEYWLKRESGMLAKRMTVSAKPTEKTLFRVSSRTYFDEDFRKECYYERLMHPAIVTDSVKKAIEITAPFAQPGFMGQATDGCSQFCASNLKNGLGVGQFLLRVNDKYVYPPRALNMSYWMPWGWEMSWLACFLKPQPFSAEMETMLYEGDHFTFHSQYLQLPEWKKLHDSYTICPWAKKTRGFTNMYVGWGSMPPGDSPVHPDVLAAAKIPGQLMRPDEMIFYLQLQPGDNWGEFPAADSEKVRYREPNTDKFKQEVPCETIKHGLARLHALNLPQYKFGFYQFPIDVSPGTPSERAGMYIVDKLGNPTKGWYDPSFNTFLCDMSPGYIDFMAKSIANVLDYYKTDYIYLDYPYTPCFADWKGEGRVIQPTDVMELYRRLHEVCAQRGAALFVNSGAGVPYVDAGYFEGIPGPDVYLNRGFMEEGWKNLFSDPMMMMKLYEPTGFTSYVLAWQNFWSNPKTDNAREMTNYSLLFGMRISGASNSEWGDQLKSFTKPGGKPEWLANARSIDMYHRASMELGASQIVDVRLRPCWWKDDTRVEAYALRMGPAHVLTCLSHDMDTRPVTFSADSKRLGLKPGKRTFVWNFNVRSLDTIMRQPDPPPVGWDRLCPQITCRSFMQGTEDRLQVDMGPLPPLLVRMTAVTQVPGALVSAYGQETQFVLPHNLDCQVDGSIDETRRLVTLSVFADKPCEIIAWWPDSWGKAKAVLSGTQPQILNPVAEGFYVHYATERFLRLKVPSGESRVVLTSIE